MLKQLQERFGFDYENTASDSYLVLKADASEKILQYQIDMIAENAISGVLPFSLRQRDDVVSFNYSITSRLSLSQFLKRKKIKREELIGVLCSIAMIILEAERYLLFDKSFVLHEDWIYINPGTLEVSLLYIPVAFEANTIDTFKDFLIHLIVHVANIDENNSDNFVQRILAFTKLDTFNLSSFVTFTKTLLSDHTFQESMSPKPKAPSPQTAQKPKEEDRLPQATPKEQKPAIAIPRAVHPKIPPVAKINAPISAKERSFKSLQQSMPSQSNNTIFTYKTSTKIISASCIAVTLLILAIAYFALQKSNDPVSKFAGVSVMIVALNFLIFRRLFDKSNLIEKEIVTPTTLAPAPEKKSSHQEMMPPAPVNILPTPLINAPAPVNETMLLINTIKKSPYLQMITGAQLTKIPITKPSFFIGRLEEQVDYACDNRAVGKIHAEISCIHDQYTLKDLNSRNGTFINGEKITSNKAYALKHADKISFANSEYTFFAL